MQKENGFALNLDIFYSCGLARYHFNVYYTICQSIIFVSKRLEIKHTIVLGTSFESL